ncbi:MAG TPA: FIST N-terminal domain-containing protein [Actinomycetes bacterium]|jgi:small ligand-binding sensory domain FIST|nr:FIST N-terminal domain-containing protein [Actinomycetes bacterium]
MTRIGAGLAAGVDLVHDAAEATEQALRPLDGATPDLVCVFGSGAAADDFADAVLRVAEDSQATVVIGCTASGVIGAGAGVESEPAVSVWAGHLPAAKLRPFRLDVLRTQNGMAVIGLPDITTQDRVGLLFADPFTFPIDGFVDRSNDLVPGFPYVGGLAAGMPGDGGARLVLDGELHSRGAVGVLIGGDVEVATTLSQGCRPVGPTMAVTKAEGNIIFEMAGVPALAKLEELLTEMPDEDRLLAADGLQLGVAMDEYADAHGYGDFLIRGVVGADRATGAIVVGDVVEVGRTVRFQLRDADAARLDLDQVLARFRGNTGELSGALLFSCNGRGADVFGTADHDVRAVQAGLGLSGVAGFFAAGEIGPVGGRNYLHGFTATILAFGSQPPGIGRTAGPARRDG